MIYQQVLPVPEHEPNPKPKSVPIHVHVLVVVPDPIHVPNPLLVLDPKADHEMPSTSMTCKLNVNLILQEHKGSLMLT